MWTAEIRTVLLAKALGRVDVAVFHPKASASPSELCSSRDHTRPLLLSFALAVVLTLDAPFPENLSSAWNG